MKLSNTAKEFTAHLSSQWWYGKKKDKQKDYLTRTVSIDALFQKVLNRDFKGFTLTVMWKDTERERPKGWRMNG